MVYSPILERFLETDPAEYIDGPNKYQIELGNPIVGLDPTGLADQTDMPQLRAGPPLRDPLDDPFDAALHYYNPTSDTYYSFSEGGALVDALKAATQTQETAEQNALKIQQALIDWSKTAGNGAKEDELLNKYENISAAYTGYYLGGMLGQVLIYITAKTKVKQTVVDCDWVMVQGNSRRTWDIADEFRSHSHVDLTQGWTDSFSGFFQHVGGLAEDVASIPGHTLTFFVKWHDSASITFWRNIKTNQIVFKNPVSPPTTVPSTAPAK